MTSLLARLGFPSSSEQMTAQRSAYREETRVHVRTEPAVSAPVVAVAVADIEAPPPAPPKEPVPVPPAEIHVHADMADELRGQYVALAAELGITQPGLLKDAARAFFRDRGTRLYDSAKVHAYLDDQYGNETLHEQHTDSHCNCCTNGRHVIPLKTATWGWRALRTSDLEIKPQLPNDTDTQRFYWQQNRYTSTKNNELCRGWHVQPYTKPLPLPVLLTVKEVITAFPSVLCFVSDAVSRADGAMSVGVANIPAARPVLDPFLLVVIEDERFIIERWDEPAYRE